MATKGTIALIASTLERTIAIVNKLSVKNYRLLLVSKYENEFDEFSQKIQIDHPGMEVDVITCMKDGCWEADIIILDVPPTEQREVAAMIMEVATQKLVINFSNDYRLTFDENNLQKLLKHSKVVNVSDTSNSFEILEPLTDITTASFVSDLLSKSENNSN